MGYRILEINLISAKGLKHVNLFTKMDVYTIVSIVSDDKEDKQKTPVDSEGNTNPSWNIPVKFRIDESAAAQNRLTLVFKLRCQRSLGDKNVGEVIVPVKELLDTGGDGKSIKFLQYQVRKPSGKPKGELSFSYKFDPKDVVELAPEKESENIVVSIGQIIAPSVGTSKMYPSLDEVTMYPSLDEVTKLGAYPIPTGGGTLPPPVAANVGYNYTLPRYDRNPQQRLIQSQSQYGGFQPSNYGYQLQPINYRYMPVQQQYPSQFGLGLGVGLLGGALGGLVIGDMVSDIGS